MARTTKEIHTAMLADMVNYPALSGITSASKTALFSLFAWVVAAAINTVEVLWDIFTLEMETLAKAAIPGTAYWYRQRSLEFQYSDTVAQQLEYVDEVFTYTTIDEDLQLVKLCSVTETNGQVRLKVAKHDASGLPEKLLTDEKAAFKSYLNKIKFAGTGIGVISDDGDDLQFVIEVYHNGLVDFSTLQGNVEAAVQGYIQGLPWDGMLKVMHLIDAIQVVYSVTDVKVSAASARYGVLPFSSIDREHNPNAGYYQIYGGFPLTDTIQPNGDHYTSNASGTTIKYIID